MNRYHDLLKEQTRLSKKIKSEYTLLDLLKANLVNAEKNLLSSQNLDAIQFDKLKKDVQLKQGEVYQQEKTIKRLELRLTDVENLLK